jgi:actin-related protein
MAPTHSPKPIDFEEKKEKKKKKKKARRKKKAEKAASSDDESAKEDTVTAGTENEEIDVQFEIELSLFTQKLRSARRLCD